MHGLSVLYALPNPQSQALSRLAKHAQSGHADRVMNCLRHRPEISLSLFAAVGLCWLLGSPASSQAAPAATATRTLSADDIMQRAVERAESPACSSDRPDYQYRKHTISEEVDKKGKLKEHKEKLYDVLVRSGLSSLTLVQINGQDLSPAELKKQQEHDAAERAKLADTKPDKRGDNRENFLNAELVGKYNFKLVEQQQLKGRPTYMLTFEPKSNLPIKHLTDRFVNHIAGTVWIDAQDFEIAKADLHLQAEVQLWGGIIGTLRRCDFSLQRVRLPDGVWFNSFSHGVFEGRKLLEPLLIKTMSESSDFRRITLAKK